MPQMIVIKVVSRFFLIPLIVRLKCRQLTHFQFVENIEYAAPLGKSDHSILHYIL